VSLDKDANPLVFTPLYVIVYCMDSAGSKLMLVSWFDEVLNQRKLSI